MKAVSDYKEIVPKKKWFATLVTRIFSSLSGWVCRLPIA